MPDLEDDWPYDATPPILNNAINNSVIEMPQGLHTKTQTNLLLPADVENTHEKKRQKRNFRFKANHKKDATGKLNKIQGSQWHPSPFFNSEGQLLKLDLF